MTLDLSSLDSVPRVLFEIPLRPLQGKRFQPTGFPNLGAATFQTSEGLNLLVESTQSLANRLELTVWDATKQDVVSALQGISHVRVNRGGKFLTDTILEAHRLNSPYLLESKKDKSFFNAIKEEVGALETGPIDRKKLSEVLLKYDVGSLLHGVFLAKPGLAGGRLRVARAISAFIEADGVRVAASGGVKNDHVNPSGAAKEGFGNVPFARDEFTAERITLYANIDLVQMRGYALGDDITRLLILLSLYKLRALVDGHLRLRTACEFELVNESVTAKRPADFSLPSLSTLEPVLKVAIAAAADRMKVTEVSFEDELKKNAGASGVDEDDKPEDSRDD